MKKPEVRWEIINLIAKKIEAKKYLEIGVESGITFQYVNVPYKVGVDPDPNCKPEFVKYPFHSDKFFSNNNENFDIIFIDGLHHAEQVYKDIKNSLSILNPGGVIICHDMLPPTENHQIVPRMQGQWNGDCWKAWLILRSENEFLNMNIVDVDFGCGIIMKGHQELADFNSTLYYEQMTYDMLIENMHKMNVIGIDEFVKSWT